MPETTKISMMQPGIYCYSGHNYSGDAHMDMITNGPARLYAVPSASEIDGPTGRVTPVKTISV